MQLDLAEGRQARLGRVADQTAARALRLWRARFTSDFDAAWSLLAPQLVAIVAAGQVQAAAGASPFLASTASADGGTGPSGGVVEPAAYAGVDASGRTLEGLLYGAVTTAKTAIGRGAGLQSAFMTSGTYLAVMAHTAVLDTGRSSDLTAMTARNYTHYVRVVSAGACSRCAILAGMQSAQRPFKRHPNCRCTAAPENDQEALHGRYASPAAYFESLDRAEQDKVFTKAGAEAIRAGADEITVVTARRGAVGIDYSRAVVDARTLPNSGRRLIKSVIGRDADGNPILGYTTGEGTTVRGSFGRQAQTAKTGTVRRSGARYRSAQRIRLMPETIIGLTDDVHLRQVLLRDAGYLRAPTTAAERSAPLGGGYATRRAAQIRADRAEADAFYRAHGIARG